MTQVIFSSFVPSLKSLGQVKKLNFKSLPLITCASLGLPKKFFPKNALIGLFKVCTKFKFCSTGISWYTIATWNTTLVLSNKLEVENGPFHKTLFTYSEVVKTLRIMGAREGKGRCNPILVSPKLNQYEFNSNHRGRRIRTPQLTCTRKSCDLPFSRWLNQSISSTCVTFINCRFQI